MVRVSTCLQLLIPAQCCSFRPRCYETSGLSAPAERKENNSYCFTVPPRKRSSRKEIRIRSLMSSEYFIHKQAGRKNLCVLPTQCIYEFYVHTSEQTSHFPIQHWLLFYSRTHTHTFTQTMVISQANLFHFGKICYKYVYVMLQWLNGKCKTESMGEEGWSWNVSNTVAWISGSWFEA